MASAYFSSQTTIEAKVRASRVRLWGDKNADGTLAPTTLDQGLLFAKTHILSSVKRRYGTQALIATFDSCPPLLKAVSDDLVLYYLATGANVVNPVIDMLYKNALATLENIREYRVDVPEWDDTPAIETATEETESIFDDLMLSDTSSIESVIIR